MNTVSSEDVQLYVIAFLIGIFLLCTLVLFFQKGMIADMKKRSQELEQQFIDSNPADRPVDNFKGFS